jgi:hypothetical protein
VYNVGCIYRAEYQQYQEATVEAEDEYEVIAEEEGVEYEEYE